MPEYHGSALFVQWIWASGTITVSGTFRSFNYNPDVQLIESTNGADQANTYLAGVKSGKATLTYVDETGSTTSGTALTTAMAEGNSGTLIWAPEGTATGKPKKTAPMISQGCKTNQPYNNIVEVSVDFQQNGVRTDGVY